MPVIKLNGNEYSGGGSNVDITTTLTQDTVSDTSVPSAKVVYDELQNVDAKMLEGKSASDFLSVDGGTINGKLTIGNTGTAGNGNVTTIITYDNGTFIRNKVDDNNRTDLIFDKSNMYYSKTVDGVTTSNTVIHSGNVKEQIIDDTSTTAEDKTWSAKQIVSSLAQKVNYITFNGENYNDMPHTGRVTIVDCANTGATNSPKSISGSNQHIVLYFYLSDDYRAQYAFGFGGNGIAKRNCSGSTTWSEWTLC